MLATAGSFDPFTLKVQCELIKFKGYSDQQLREMLKKNFSDHLTRLHKPASSLSLSSPSSSSILPSVEIQNENSVILAYQTILDSALPVLLLVSRQIDELFQASLAIFISLFSVKLNDENIVQAVTGHAASSDEILRTAYRILDRHIMNVPEDDLLFSSRKLKSRNTSILPTKENSETVSNKQEYRFNSDQPFHLLERNTRKHLHYLFSYSLTTT